MKVFEVDGEFLVVDGFCRVLAAQNVGKSRIDCEITKGTFKDALRAACGANVSHGLRRTIADKRKAATIAIAEFPDETSRALAELVGVSHTYIVNLRDGDKKIQKIIDHAATGEVPKLIPDSSPKPSPKPKSIEEILDVVSPPGWNCSDCGCTEQRLSDGGNVCRQCLCPVGENATDTTDEPAVDMSSSSTSATESLETFPDPIPEKMAAVHTSWGRFIRSCEQANCTPVLKQEIESITKKLKGLR